MRSPALPAVLALLAGLLTALPAPADTTSGLPSGKRQHKPVVVGALWNGYRSDARRLKNPQQRRAALELIDALETAKHRHLSGFDKSHRLNRGRNSRSSQNGQSDLNFLRERARRQGKGGNEVAMEELTLSHEGLVLLRGPYNRLRQSLGARTECVQKCDRVKLRCEARCRAGKCACIMAASDCLLTEIHAKRCATAFSHGWPSKVTGPSWKSDTDK